MSLNSEDFHLPLTEPNSEFLLRLIIDSYCLSRETFNTLAETCVFFKGNPTETYKKVVRFRRNRSHGNMNKPRVSATGNTC